MNFCIERVNNMVDNLLKLYNMEELKSLLLKYSICASHSDFSGLDMIL